MFENQKDTILLQGALLSASNINSGSLFDCGALEDAVNIVFNSLKKIINQSLDGIKGEKDRIKSQLHINRRLHAAVFFTTLRSHGITSEAADTFYSSIADLWPPMDLKFYIELNFRCDWSDYFIKCASQLSTDILHKVLKIILDIPFSKCVESYSWHLILQSLILNLLEVPHDDEINFPFHFDFTGESSPVMEYQSIEVTEKCIEIVADLLNKKPQNELTLLKDMYKNLCDCISAEIMKSNNINLIKIILHAIKTLLKNLLNERERSYENISKYVDFLNIYNIMNDCLKSDSSKETLKAAMCNSAGLTVKHSYATLSWNISECYLCFLLSYYWNKMLSDFYFKIELSTRNILVYSQIIRNTCLYETLNVLNPLYSNCSEIEDRDLNFLYKVIQLEFEGAPYVVELFLSEPHFIEKNNSIEVLEENIHSVDFMKMYPFILRSVKAVKSQDLKFRLLKMFYSLLPIDNFRIYNDVLITILTEYGLTEEFELPDFSEQLSQCFRTTLNIKEAEETFPVMFVQNPMTLLKRVIDQTLIQGPEGRPYIEPLKYVQFVCTYQENKDTMPALIGILNGYFEKSKLEPWESKNMVTLYKFLMKIQSKDSHIVALDVFFSKCIIPKLQCDVDNIELILECVYVSVTILVQNKLFFIGYETLMSLIASLGKLINDCIETGNARLKASVLPVIQALNSHQLASRDVKDKDKLTLWSKFHPFHEGVYVYMNEFLPQNIECSSESFVWTFCCKNNDSVHFEEQFPIKTLSHPVLLCTLVEVLPYFTKEEWLYSIQLIRICLKNYSLREEILHLSNKPFHLSEKELDTYAVVSCVLTSLHFILNGNKDPAYIISCFANSLMMILSQDKAENIYLLMTIFLECCYLVKCVSSDMSSLIILFLLDLKKCITTSCSEKTYKKYCAKLMSCAIKYLPSFCDKTVLLSS